jgi:hypothetical protein
VDRGTDDGGSGGGGSVVWVPAPPPQLARTMHNKNSPNRSNTNLSILASFKTSEFDAFAGMRVARFPLPPGITRKHPAVWIKWMKKRRFRFLLRCRNL